MGMPAFPSRKSTESNPSIKASLFFNGCAAQTLDTADDFSDVFGGPPRSVLTRNFSGDFTRSTGAFYEEMFHPPDFVAPAPKGGKSLPAFRIPAKNEGFYSDIFASEADDLRRSRDRSRSNSKAKSNSSSVLSSEELSPAGEDAALSSFASKLRPINVACKWNSNEQRNQGHMPPFPCNQFAENEYSSNFRGSYNDFSGQACSPETISLDPNSFPSIRVSRDDLELNSPASPASSLCQEPEARPDTATEDEEDEVMSSYVIEINSDCYRQVTNEAVSIDEAIAWAKEKYQTHVSEMQNEKQCSVDEMTDDNGEESSSSMERERKNPKQQEPELTKEQIEMELIDENINLWSAGKETNIRMLLSTLHHVLWANSGWHAVPIHSLIDGAQVKRAYQKARLCLHPDKLQQRGVMQSQKYLANKAFTALQDAWAAFVSQDTIFG